MEKFESITKASFEEAVDALLNAHSQNSNKGKLLKEWFTNSFGTSATVSHVKEDKQTGNRVKEQFDHKLPIVVFVCADEINRNTLIKNVREKSYPELNTVLIMSSGAPHKYETLLSKDDDDFTMWAQTNLGIIPEQLEALSDLAKQRENDFKNYLVNVVGNKQENLEGYLSHLDRSFAKTILRQYTGKPFVYEITDLDLLELVLKKVRQSPEDQKGNRNTSSRISRYIKFLRGITDSMAKTTLPLQKIVYGAPGTGKSFATDDKIKDIYPSKDERKDNVFRTTFHPDSDYSAFVGAYKPTKLKEEKVVKSKEKLKIEFESTGKVSARQIASFVGLNYFSFSSTDITKEDWLYIFQKASESENTINAYVPLGLETAEKILEMLGENFNTITYDFVPQSFTKAYIKAWEEKLLAEYAKKDDEQKATVLPTENGEAKKVKAKPVYLVIEEINRGNCAQIFGDLFQLLDRNDDEDSDDCGMSCYPIKPDTDLGNYIAGELRKFAQEHNIDIDSTRYKEIINGEEMLLPDNLYIWATMNTSDQSLFPIDSAFKRRWDWEYVPISEGFDRKTGDPIKHTIKIDNETCDWWEFVKAINKKIGDTTKSEDKKLGFYFCKADSDGIIDAKKFVGKVIFYLWNDVFKDYETELFNIGGNDDNPTFEMFYKSDKGKTEIDDVKVKEFIEKVCPGIFSKVNSEEKQKEEE